MPPDRSSPRDPFNISLLDSRALDTPDGLAAALCAIEAVCHGDDLEILGVIEMLNGRPYILEYIISGTLRVPVDPSRLFLLTISP